MKTDGLLAWQWRHYRDNHHDRANLLIHVLTQPLFVAGVAAVIAAPFTMLWLFAAGPAAMLVAMALQGRGHRREEVAPAPFRGPLDVARRIFAEQLITFPRYVLTGEIVRAWRRAR